MVLPAARREGTKASPVRVDNGAAVTVISFDPSGWTAVYRLYDADGVLLYVGVTDEPKTRFKTHAGTKSWWPSVYSRRIEWHQDRAAAETAERTAIREEYPLWNRDDSPWAPVEVAGGKLAVAEKAAATPRPRIAEALTSVPACIAPETQTDDEEDRAYSTMLHAVVEEIRSGAVGAGDRLWSGSSMAERFSVHRAKVARLMERLRWIGLVTGPPGGITRVAPEPARTLALELYDRAAGLRHIGRCAACSSDGQIIERTAA